MELGNPNIDTGDGELTSKPSSARPEPLVQISPSDSLKFYLKESQQSNGKLTIRNVSPHKLCYKVKTRRPKWWHVTPVQAVLDVGETMDVSVNMAEAEVTRFCREPQSVVAEAKYRLFLVQACVVSDEEYAEILELPTAKRADLYKHLWSIPRSETDGGLDICKVKVDFIFGSGATGSTPNTSPARDGSNAQDNSARIAEIRDKIEAKAKWSQQQRATEGGDVDALGGSSGAAAFGSVLESSGDYGDVDDADDLDDGGDFQQKAINEKRRRVELERAHERTRAEQRTTFSELQALRKKFDAILEYTCHLTQERDVMVDQIKELKRQHARDMAGKEDEAKEGTEITKDEGATKGFSFFFVVVASLLFFFLGRFLRTSTRMTEDL